MSCVKTFTAYGSDNYDGQAGPSIKKVDTGLLSRFTCRKPGDFVTHRWAGGFGTLVSTCHDGSCTVLWSIEPNFRKWIYNPLACDEDIYIPIRTPK